jgi:DNA polymerase III subunit epsilon
MAWRSVPFAALDFETTGLDLDKDAIVSFGVVPVLEGRVVVGQSVHQLVVPEVPSSVLSMKVHQILPQDVIEAPPLEVAREQLRRAIEHKFLLTWYADVEVAFLGRIFGGRRREWIRRTIDVRELALVAEDVQGFPGVRFSLSAMADRYGVPVASPHEALDDALVTAQLFLILAAKLRGQGYTRVKHLLGATRA